jgi:tetratricopeptide (TPR) repeat protein
MEKPLIASSISFKDVRALAANEGWSKRLLDQLDRFLGVAILLTPAVLGPSGVFALALLEPKDELIKIGRSLIRRFSSASTEDFVLRRRRMTAAYCLMTYTAFFAALDVKLPDFVKKVALTNEERSLIAERANPQDSQVAQPQDVATLIEVPHPAMTPAAERAARTELYQGLARAYLSFVQGLAIWESSTYGQRMQVTADVQALPELATEIFESQYLELIIKYPDFHLWAELYELTKSRQLSSDLIGDLEEKIRLVAEAVQGIDVGLRHLNELVEAAGQHTAGEDLTSRIAQGLHNVYVSGIEQPIISDQRALTSSLTLAYPKKCDIFVPQSFQAIRYLDRQLRLELESAWANVAVSKDLGTFTLRYLESVYSTEAPLLVLGHPGSGKSLYTEIIAARFATRYHPIRIELRDIDAEAELQDQIEHQIHRDTGYTVNWALLADEWHDNPPVIILDGYDELLQASGKVFSNYLARVQAFQRREALQGRPVRVIVTSRITLIDKTVMPLGVTVVRLRDFDEIRRDQWIEIWNATNGAYFAATGVRPFGLGPDWGPSQLAAQPLLLLMLAIYDSDSNQLRHANLDRTLLYHSLLMRFIERERTKGASADEFLALTPAERSAQIESDFQRLGVTALGMFNRRSLYIQRDELNKDIAYFRLGRERDFPYGTKLTQAELLLGSFFFFIHESKTRSLAGDETIAPTAFEFLHNTFGEFLTADFILRKLLATTHGIRTLSADPHLFAMRDQQLGQPHDDWLACLVYTSLHTRPVVCSMMREWLVHRLKMEGRKPDDFEEDLAVVTLRQLGEVLSGNAASTVSRHVKESPYETFSILGHLAVYSLNLVLLMLSLTRGEVTVSEASLATPLAGCRPWDRLISLWRSWFSLESLVGLRSAMQARRRDEAIILSRPSHELAKGRSALEDTCNVADSLADDVVYGLAAPHAFDAAGVSLDHLSSAAERLSLGGIDLFHLFAARMADDGIPWLRSLADHIARSGRFDEAENLCRRALEILELSGDRIDLADTYVQLARIMYSSGQVPAAEDCYQKAAEMLNPLGSLRRVGEIYREVAELKSAAAIFDEAEGWSHRAAEIFERLGDRPRMADTYRQLGSFLLDAGRLDSARPHLTLALQIFEKLGDQSGIAETRRQLGDLDSLTGRFAEAEDWYRRSREISDRLNDQLAIACTYVRLGQFRWRTKRFEQAESFYRRAESVFERCGARLQLADVQYWLGKLAHQKRQFESAKSRYRQALDLFEKIGNRLLAAPTYHQLGTLYQEQGQVEKAESNYRQALDLYLEKGDRRTSQTASMLAELLAEHNRHLEACDVLLSSAKVSYEITGKWDLADLKFLSRERQILGHAPFWKLITARLPQDLQNEFITVIKRSSKLLVQSLIIHGDRSLGWSGGEAAWRALILGRGCDRARLAVSLPETSFSLVKRRAGTRR